MSDSSWSHDTYARFEGTPWVVSYHPGPTPSIKSDHATSSQLMNHIPTVLSQGHGNHQSSDTYANSAQPTQSLLHSRQNPHIPLRHQMAQLQPSSQKSALSAWNQMPQLPHPPTARTPLPQPPFLEESSCPLEDTPFHVKAKQYNRILKRRVTRQKTGYKPPDHKSYQHESRHKHVLKRPRDSAGKFLTRDELKRQERDVQTGSIIRCRTPKTRTGPNSNPTKEESADLEAGVRTQDGRSEWREEARKGSQNDQPHEPEIWQTHYPRSQSQVYVNRPEDNSRAMTTSFYGADQLQALHKRFETTTPADVQHTQRNFNS